MQRAIHRGTGLKQDTIRFIRHGRNVKPITLRKVLKFLEEQKPREKPFSADTLSDPPDLKELRDILDLHIAILDKRIHRFRSHARVTGSKIISPRSRAVR